MPFFVWFNQDFCALSFYLLVKTGRFAEESTEGLVARQSSIVMASANRSWHATLATGIVCSCVDVEYRQYSDSASSAALLNRLGLGRDEGAERNADSGSGFKRGAGGTMRHAGPARRETLRRGNDVCKLRFIKHRFDVVLISHISLGRQPLYPAVSLISTSYFLLLKLITKKQHKMSLL